MTLIRCGAESVLHYSKAGDRSLCGETGTIVTTGTRDDLLCGLCQDELDWLALSEIERRQLYRSYMASIRWAHTRALALEHYGTACLLCGTEEELDVHHRTYARLGRERLSDLAPLCRSCHDRFHRDEAA